MGKGIPGRTQLASARPGQDVVALGDGPTERLGLLLEVGTTRLQGEQHPHEVPLGGVLFQPPEQVADRHIEVSGGNDRRVEPELAAGFPHHPRLSGGHSGQHL